MSGEFTASPMVSSVASRAVMALQYKRSARRVRRCSRFPPSPPAPIFLRLALHRRARWLLHLEPVAAAARAVERLQPLRHDPLAPEGGGVLEHDVDLMNVDAAGVVGLGRTNVPVILHNGFGGRV